MASCKILLSLVTLTFLAVLATACGNSYSSNRVLQSMTISPANPDAQSFANGQVQFTATGSFSKAPSPDQVTFQAPYSGSWALIGANDSSIATITPTGLAQCIPGAAGTVTVKATASSNSASGPAMSTGVMATTSMTCP